jgi:hypothetical protein
MNQSIRSDGQSSRGAAKAPDAAEVDQLWAIHSVSPQAVLKPYEAESHPRLGSLNSSSLTTLLDSFPIGF